MGSASQRFVTMRSILSLALSAPAARLDAHEERPPGLDLRGCLHRHVRARASREQSYKRSRGRAAFYKFYHDKRLRYELPIIIVSARAAVKPARYTFPRAFEAASGNII